MVASVGSDYPSACNGVAIDGFAQSNYMSWKSGYDQSGGISTHLMYLHSVGAGNPLYAYTDQVSWGDTVVFSVTINSPYGYSSFGYRWVAIE